jgi:hypothetical protein
MLRHIYQEEKARAAFLNWANESGRTDVIESANIWYAAEWRRIDAILGIDLPKAGE